MKMFKEPHQVEEYLNVEIECDCGHTHYVPIRGVEIGPGAINTLPEYVKKFGYHKPYVICDAITYKIAASKCEELLSTNGISSSVHIITHLGFDEATLGELIINMPSDCDLMIAVGTGTITDMIRYCSFKLHLPCFTVATGAPMDGFAASIGVMNVNNLKCTMDAHNTELIIGDTDILQTAPYRMTVAGFGDLIGKISCLNDWELSRIINNEHYCSDIVNLVRDCVDNILKEAPRIKDRDPKVLGNVMRGLVLSGAAISLYGNSRPASGAEHHMSHFWETIGDQRGKPFSMHGEQVAVGTVLALMLCEELMGINVDFDAARTAARAYSPDIWEKTIHEIYGEAAQEILEIEAVSGKNNPEQRLRRIDSIETHWPEILEQLKSLPKAEGLVSILKGIGSPCFPVDMNIDAELLKNTLLYCKEVRTRYTILSMLADLNILDEMSDRVIKKIY